MQDNELFHKNFDNFRQTRRDADKAIDHVVLLVSTGSFIASISFLAFLDKFPNYPLLLAASWLFLGLTVLTHIYCYILVIRESNLLISYLKSYPQNSAVGISLYLMRKESEPEYKSINKKINGMNIVVLTLMTIGVAALFLFAVGNLIAY